MKLSVLAVALVLLSEAPAQTQKLPTFLGRQITVTTPGADEGGFPKGPASVCIEGPLLRQCFTAPAGDHFAFGNNPTVAIVELQKGKPALLFSAETGGTSGWTVRFALLRPGAGKDLEDCLPDVEVSNQSQHALWSVPDVSDAMIFVTADYARGPDESHYQDHRYTVSAYMLEPSSMVDDLYYYLEDQYMTTHKYDVDKADILTSEKHEIITRLRRLRAEKQRVKRSNSQREPASPRQ